tara:strand:- start:561 stop:797 length:237 start_codon:yes stop_codon:yes gene_type:complete
MKDRYHCTVQDFKGDILFDKKYKTLMDIATDLGLTYSIISDIVIKRRLDKKWKNFKFQPKIEIQKLNVDKNKDDGDSD